MHDFRPEQRFPDQSGGSGGGFFLSLALLALVWVPGVVAAPTSGSVGGVPELQRTQRLATGWQFSPHDRASFADHDYEPVESDWVNVALPDLRKVSGIFWYRLEFELQLRVQSGSNEPLALYLGAVDDADQTFLNGVLIGQTGAFPPNGKPAYREHRVYPIPAGTLRQGRNVIAVRVWNWGSRGGMYEGMPLVGALSMLAPYFRTSIMRDMNELVITAVLLLVSLYFAYLWLNLPARSENLLFALFVADVAIYRFTLTELFVQLMPSAGAAKRIELSVLYIGGVIFYHFVMRFLGRRSSPFFRAYEALVAGALLYMALSPFGPPWEMILRAWQYSLPAFLGLILYVIGASARDGHPEAKLMVYGIVIVSFTIVYDVLRALGYHRNSWLAGYGFLAFMVFVTLILADRYVRLYQASTTRSETLRDLDRRKTEFLANISHELKTPLTSVVGYVELLEGGLISASQNQSSHHEIQSGALRLHGIVSDAVLLSMLDAGTFDLRMEAVDLASVVRDAQEELRPLTEERGVTLEVEGLNVSLWGDRSLISRALGHVLENAVLYNRVGGSVRVKATPAGGNVQLDISDDGSGIPPNLERRLFEKFVRGDTSDTYDSPGTGTGLALSSLCLGLMGGRLELLSSNAQGSTFRLTLPEAFVAAAEGINVSSG